MNAPARIETGIVDIRGKQYETVALRVQKFRAAHPDKSLTTEMIVRDDECVVMRAIIADEAGRVLATGHSEEYREASQINRTSALENAETSAIGRALAAYGFGGTEFATANEVANAIHQQGAGGQRQGGTVSPQPPKPAPWREESDLYPNPSKLHKGLTQLERELAGCGDSEMVYGLTSTREWTEFVRIAEKHAPHYLRGGDPAPPEFRGLLNIAADMVARFDGEIADNMAALART